MPHSEESHPLELGETKQEPILDPASPFFTEPWPARFHAAPDDGTMFVEELKQRIDSPEMTIEQRGFSIRIPPKRESVACGGCGKVFEIGGPTGFEAEIPVCDPCLLEGAPILGLLLALAHITRVYGAFRPEKAEDLRRALVDYGAFARIYEHVAAKEGPVRPFFLDTLSSH